MVSLNVEGSDLVSGVVTFSVVIDGVGLLEVSFSKVDSTLIEEV